jgi:acyl carrier protein
VLKTPSRTELEETIYGKIRSVLAERDSDVRVIHSRDSLNAVLGLTSLDLATVVAELESALGVDPFARVVSITSVRTVDDLVEAYLKAYIPDANGVENDEGLLEASRRGGVRRARRGA